MSLEQTLADNEDTGSSTETQAQAAEKTYTQKEMDDMAARIKTAVTKRVLKQYEDLGDIEELRALKQSREQQRVEEATRQGNFESVLKELAAKKDAEIARRDAVIRDYKIDNPLLSTAAKYRAVAPEQVKSLLKNQVRLSGEGEVEVLDDSGQVRYTDRGTVMTVDELVSEFLNRNPHFVQAAPATTATKNSVMNSQKKLDVSKLDMSNPEHRAQYREYRKSQGLR